MKNKGLGNPAVISSVLASEQGQKAIGKTQDVFFTVLKVGLVATVLVVAYYKIFKGFTKLKEESNYYPSNISITNAKARAEALYTAMLGFGANYDAVESSLKGLNHNGFIRVYNEFGERRSATLSKMNLVEWIQDQFKSQEDIAKLRYLIQGFF